VLFYFGMVIRPVNITKTPLVFCKLLFFKNSQKYFSSFSISSPECQKNLKKKEKKSRDFFLPLRGLS